MKIDKNLQRAIVRYLDQEMNDDEAKALIEWIDASDGNAKLFAEMRILWDASLGDAPRVAGTDQEWQRFRERVTVQKKVEAPRRLDVRRMRWPAVAAMLAVALLISSLVQIQHSLQPVTFTANAPKGSMAQVLLPDNTIVYLNAASEISYTMNRRSSPREVHLKGEAYFDVTEMKRRPFLVHTSGYDVEVKGTSFNVKAFEDDKQIETTLEEGRVVITPTPEAPFSKNIYLNPGEQFIYDKEMKRGEVKRVNTRYYVSWKENKLLFINMNLGELFKLMERKYGVEIDIDDKSILNFHYSGTINDESVLEMLDIIKYTLPVEYNIEGQRIHITGK